MTKRLKGQYLTRRSNGFYYYGLRSDGKIHWTSLRVKTKSEALRLFTSLANTRLPHKHQRIITISAFFPLFTECCQRWERIGRVQHYI